MEYLFEELKRYVRFGAVDEHHLETLGPLVAGALPGVVEEFYQRIAQDPGALAVMKGGDPQMDRLRVSLQAWLEEFFRGPWDDAYALHRARIGRRHVEVKLPQHYMLTAMSVIRVDLCGIVTRLGGAPQLVTERLAAVNKLCDLELAIMLHTYREDSARELQSRERMATYGEMTSAICHELRNPLGVLESSIFLVRRRSKDAHVIEHLDRMHRQVRRASYIITNMLEIVRSTIRKVQRVEACGLAEQAILQLKEDRGTDVELVAHDRSLKVEADPAQVLQVLANLLGNAVDAAGPQGHVRLTVLPHNLERGPHVRFLVSDTGPGVDAEIAHRVFEPLVTTKESGIGLGLALSRKLAEQQPGVLDMVPGELSGAGFALDLPRVVGSGATNS